jgi:hypothetical protein
VKSRAISNLFSFFYAPCIEFRSKMDTNVYTVSHYYIQFCFTSNIQDINGRLNFE